MTAAAAAQGKQQPPLPPDTPTTVPTVGTQSPVASPMLKKKKKKKRAPQQHNKRSTTTTTSSNNRRQAELQALRQRGLTTLLNRHFTETTRQIAHEKAATEAALQDLQRRKEQTREFTFKADGTLSPTDALYRKLSAWRAEARRKERETLLLYHRYVRKFGETGHVRVPQTAGGEIPAWAKHASGPGSRNKEIKLPADYCPPSTPVSMASQQIETALAEFVAQQYGALSQPSFVALGSKEETYAAVFEQHEAEFKQFFLRKLEQNGVDATAQKPWEGKQLVAGTAAHAAPQANNDPFLRTIAEKSSYDEENDEQQNEDDDCCDGPLSFVPQDYNDDDDQSVVSGLTTLNSAETKRILQDCERSVATFLKEEHAAIRLMMNEQQQDAARDDTLTAVSSSDETLDSARGADQAENMVKQMQAILDDFQQQDHKSGDGVDDSQDSDTVQAVKNCRPVPTDNPAEDWVAYYDETVQREYFHERCTNRTQWEPPDATVTEVEETESEAWDYTPGGTTSLYDQYQKRRVRRRRRRRRRILVALVLLLVGAWWLWRHYQQEDAFAAVVDAKLATVQDWVCEQLLPTSAKEYLGKRSVCAAPAVVVERNMEIPVCTTDFRHHLVVVPPSAVVAHRPWFCNIPLVYVVHAGCRAAAPIFDLHAIVTSMMQ